MKYKHLFYYWAFRHSAGNTFALSVAAILLVLFIVWAVLFHTGIWIAAIIWFGVWAAWCSRLNPAWRHTFGDLAEWNFGCIFYPNGIKFVNSYCSVDRLITIWKFAGSWRYKLYYPFSIQEGFKSAPEAAFAAMDLKKQLVEKKSWFFVRVAYICSATTYDNELFPPSVLQ